MILAPITIRNQTAALEIPAPKCYIEIAGEHSGLVPECFTLGPVAVRAAIGPG
jgi:hypothetical protein